MFCAKDKDNSTDPQSCMASEMGKGPPVKDTSSKRKSGKSSVVSADELKALDSKWPKRFSRLDSMLLAKTLQPTPQSAFHQMSMPVH